MDEKTRDQLKIPAARLEELNAMLLAPGSRVIGDLLAVMSRYGTPEEINRKAAQASELPALLKRVEEGRPDYLADLRWLVEQRDHGAFIPIADYRRLADEYAADAVVAVALAKGLIREKK